MKRHIMVLELNGSAKKKVEAMSDSHGMTQVAMMSRIIEWFATQDQVTQGSIVGSMATEMGPEIAKRILKQMSEK